MTSLSLPVPKEGEGEGEGFDGLGWRVADTWVPGVGCEVSELALFLVWLRSRGSTSDCAGYVTSCGVVVLEEIYRGQYDSVSMLA